MTSTHVVLATQSSVYVWNYRDATDDEGIIGAIPGMEGLMLSDKKDKDDESGGVLGKREKLTQKQR